MASFKELLRANWVSVPLKAIPEAGGDAACSVMACEGLRNGWINLLGQILPVTAGLGMQHCGYLPKACYR